MEGEGENLNRFKLNKICGKKNLDFNIIMVLVILFNVFFDYFKSIYLRLL